MCIGAALRTFAQHRNSTRDHSACGTKSTVLLSRKKGIMSTDVCISCCAALRYCFVHERDDMLTTVTDRCSLVLLEQRLEVSNVNTSWVCWVTNKVVTSLLTCACKHARSSVINSRNSPNLVKLSMNAQCSDIHAVHTSSHRSWCCHCYKQHDSSLLVPSLAACSQWQTRNLLNCCHCCCCCCNNTR
jgi:hypothetical protein